MKQQDNQNIFEKAAQVFYGSQKQKVEEEENLRNTLLNQLGDKLETKHVLYSSIDELKKMKDEMDAQNSENNFKSKFTGAAASADEVNENPSAPLPSSNKQTNSSTKETLNEIQIESQTKIPQEQKPILLDKIPVERKESEYDSPNLKGDSKNQDSKIQQPNYEMEPLKAYIDYDEYVDEKKDKNEVQVSNLKKAPSETTLGDEQFRKIMKHVYNTEGGFVDDPDDRGGRTNKGVTQRTYDAYNKKHGLPQKDVKNITKAEADKIYHDEYWVASGANKIKDKNLAYMHYDAAINHGVGRAKKLLEQSDGDFDKYYQVRKNFYDNIVKSRPEQQKYYKGWINRIEGIDKIRKENALE